MKETVSRIGIHVSGERGVVYAKEPLSFGVPFAEGAFPTGSRLRAVRADGREIPVQTSVMATWKPDLRDIKWLLADLQVDPTVDGETVYLAAADAGEPAAPEHAVTTGESNGILTVDTGVLRLKLRKDYGRKRRWATDSAFLGCEVKTGDAWREVMQGPGLLLYMKDQRGNLYTSLGICPEPKIVIEEQGPLRVCLLVTGHLMSETGLRFCPYKLRIHLYAGKADLRIFHTFVFDQDPTRIELAGIGLKVFMLPGDDATAAVGGAGSPICADGAFDCLSIMQSDDLHFSAKRDGQSVGTGEKAAGWASLSGSQSSVVAGVRDFWQEYPKGFRVERDVLCIGVWPEDAPEPLRFVTPFEGTPVNFNGTRDEEEVKRLLAENPDGPLALRTFHMRTEDEVRWVEDVMERLAPDRPKSYNDFLGSFTGIGAAKTTEVVLRFAAGPASSGDAAAFGAAVQEPLVGIVDPGYLCGTDAFGRFLPAGHPEFAELDRDLTAFHERIHVRPIERCRRYGMFMYGHMINAHPPCGPDWVFKLYIDSDEPEKALRYVGPFGNEAADSVEWTWGQFLRSGRRCDLRWAQLASRATADTSFVHAFPGHEANVGCIHYHGPHVWANALNRSHSNVGGIAKDYYITGNRRLRDVVLEAADGLADNKLEPCGIVTCFATISREFIIPVAILLEAYQLTWHEKYGTPAERSFNWFLRTVRTPGLIPAHVFTRGPRGDEAEVEGETFGVSCDDSQMFLPALRLFPSKELHEFILAAAKHGHRLAEAYDLTGDRAIAARILSGLRSYAGAFRNGANPGLYHHSACKSLPRGMKVVALAAEADPDGFWEYARAWQKESSPAPMPTDKARVNLGPRSTEPFRDRPIVPLAAPLACSGTHGYAMRGKD